MTVTVLRADARRLPLADASVHAVVCDPPYGLGFMGREWDAFGGRMMRDDTRVAQLASGAGWTAKSYGASGKSAAPAPGESAAFQEFSEQWAREAYRALKPGGYLLAFGGTRTAHRLTCGIEDAGFEVRGDTITWLYAQGFPKSLDVSKAIDRQRDDRSPVLQVTWWLGEQADDAGITNAQINAHMETSDMAGWWTSRLLHRCALPTWEQWLKLRELIGFGDEMDAEVWRLNGRKGTPGEAWEQREQVGEGYRVRRESTVQIVGLSEGAYPITAPATDDARRWQGWGTALKPASEPIVVARKPLAGTVAQNVQAHGTGALNIDGCRVASSENRSRPPRTPNAIYGGGRGTSLTASENNPDGRWPSNVVLSHVRAWDGTDACAEVCMPGCPVAELDRQSGVLTSGANPTRRGSDKFRDAYGDFTGQTECTPARGTDSGGASRFFPTFRYQAKAPSRERPRVNGKAHETVKPLALMRWLVRLVTPPGGTVLDPFAGSGTTAEAALLEGFDCVTCDLEPSHLPLIAARTKRSTGVAVDVPLFHLEGA